MKKRTRSSQGLRSLAAMPPLSPLTPQVASADRGTQPLGSRFGRPESLQAGGEERPKLASDAWGSTSPKV